MDQFFIIFQFFYEAHFLFQECNPGQKPVHVVFQILAPRDTQYKEFGNQVWNLIIGQFTVNLFSGLLYLNYLLK